MHFSQFDRKSKAPIKIEKLQKKAIHSFIVIKIYKNNIVIKIYKNNKKTV